ncbi:hypothetical protein GCM10023336_41780 [Streptomyces similanensis]|uniref:Uncharacterized protein n=1 Tax=Streptomyces similanensis TaxID=1274988 RepID=A0ABP9KPE5_9ACTN
MQVVSVVRSRTPRETLPVRPARAAVMSFCRAAAKPARAEVQLTAGGAAAAGVAPAAQGTSTPAPAPAAASIRARRDVREVIPR